MPVSFETSVFLNCPFDDEYAPILQAIAFCVTDLGLYPRLAPEVVDNGIARLDRIRMIVRESRFGIHDLSRCKSAAAGEYSRLNMPFELGLDYAAKTFGSGNLPTKSILVLEQHRFDYQHALSDIAGLDIHHHGGDYIKAVRVVQSWLSHQANVLNFRPSRIQGHYTAFQEWYWERELAAGASEDDIRDYPTFQLGRELINGIPKAA